MSDGYKDAVLKKFRTDIKNAKIRKGQAEVDALCAEREAYKRAKEEGRDLSRWTSASTSTSTPTTRSAPSTPAPASSSSSSSSSSSTSISDSVQLEQAQTKRKVNEVSVSQSEEVGNTITGDYTKRTVTKTKREILEDEFKTSVTMVKQKCVTDFTRQETKKFHAHMDRSLDHDDVRGALEEANIGVRMMRRKDLDSPLRLDEIWRQRDRHVFIQSEWRVEVLPPHHSHAYVGFLERPPDIVVVEAPVHVSMELLRFLAGEVSDALLFYHRD